MMANKRREFTQKAQCAISEGSKFVFFKEVIISFLLGGVSLHKGSVFLNKLFYQKQKKTIYSKSLLCYFRKFDIFVHPESQL